MVVVARADASQQPATALQLQRKDSAVAVATPNPAGHATGRDPETAFRGPLGPDVLGEAVEPSRAGR
eukprot:1010564-Lingulodinium_polyedra.AAC.1